MLDISVAVLGSGMTGLLAAKACDDIGVRMLEIFDFQRQNPRAGLHYLHDNCGMKLREGYVFNYVMGLEPGIDPYRAYSEKVYGNQAPENNSLKNLPCFSRVYSMFEAYGRLTTFFRWSMITGLSLDDIDYDEIADICRSYDLVISAIPASKVFPEGAFPSEKVGIEKGLPLNLVSRELPDNFVVYNIDKNEDWYRASKVFGMAYTEVIGEGDFQVTKVLDGVYENPYPNLLPVGRNGAWKKGLLAHEVYYQVLDHLRGRCRHGRQEFVGQHVEDPRPVQRAGAWQEDGGADTG